MYVYIINQILVNYSDNASVSPHGEQRSVTFSQETLLQQLQPLHKTTLSQMAVTTANYYWNSGKFLINKQNYTIILTAINMSDNAVQQISFL